MKCAVVIPCYNEEQRLDVEQVEALVLHQGDILASQGAELVVHLVDDGSGDGTAGLIQVIAERHPGRITARSLAKNSGKAEAVRAGLRNAVDAGADVVAYLDADMATPALEMRRLLGLLLEREKQVVFGSRVRLLGHDIQRSGMRHYLGRLFATAASLTLRLPVYDTQCGAKAFVVGPALRDALSAPFETRWVFDVELTSRLLRGPEPLSLQDFLEVPLLRWADLGGSKLTFGAMAKAALDLLDIYFSEKKRPR